jgi:hypothetical protein
MSKLEKFLNTLNKYGDMFFSNGDEKENLKTISKVIEYQGYWAGLRLRYYFDKDFNLLRTEERKFGI